LLQGCFKCCCDSCKSRYWRPASPGWCHVQVSGWSAPGVVSGWDKESCTVGRWVYQRERRRPVNWRGTDLLCRQML